MSGGTAASGRHGALVLLTSEDCHLCAHGRAVLQALGEDQSLEWREVPGESDEGRELAPSAPPMRPVLFGADGRVLAYGRLSEKRLRRELAVAVLDSTRGSTLTNGGSGDDARG